LIKIQKTRVLRVSYFGGTDYRTQNFKKLSNKTIDKPRKE